MRPTTLGAKATHTMVDVCLFPGSKLLSEGMNADSKFPKATPLGRYNFSNFCDPVIPPALWRCGLEPLGGGGS